MVYAAKRSKTRCPTHPGALLRDEIIPATGRTKSEIAELLGSETRISGDTAHGECIDRVMARNCEYSSAIGHYDVLTLANDTKAGLLQCPNSVKVVDTRDLWQRYTVTSISRMSSPRSCSSTTDKYSRIASRMFSIASSSVAP